MSESLLTQKKVCEIISFSNKLKQDTLDKQYITRSYLHEMLNEGSFPKPMKFGRTSRWLKSDIEKWLKEQKENM
jgi:predicted DNA-binding transcriptional regulator AlpA|tara:strand:+ start:440 stop:661 length:222 start_codon:yes stop_codon:yes gene_type:complete